MKTAKDKYYQEDELLTAFGITNKDLEKYACDLWLIDGYFDEKNDLEEWHEKSIPTSDRIIPKIL